MNNIQPYAFPEPQAKFIQSMLDASMHGIILLNPVRDDEQVITDFIIMAANAAIKTQIGIDPDETLGIQLSDVFPNYKIHHFFQLYLSAIDTGKLQRKELYYKDNSLEGWFDIGVAPHENMLVVTFVNITERKQYQQAIHRYAAQLYTVIDTSQSGMFLFSALKDSNGETIDFEFTMVNRALASYVGQEPQMLIGEPGSKWFPAYKTNGLFLLYRDTYETGRTNRFEFHYHADNIDVWLDIMSSKFEDEVLVTFTDYTPTKKLQLQLESSVAELKRSNAYLEEFAYAASHDLQEPLRKIQFYTDKIKLQLRSGVINESFEMLERMDSASNRMRILIDDLLAYSQISSAERNFKEVNLNLLIKEVVADLETAVKESAAIITAVNLPDIKGDKRQFYQLFQNLLSNSLKYAKPGISPEIEIKSSVVNGKESQAELPVAMENKLFHLIEVIDNGLGFEQQFAKKIFHIFQRLHGRSEYPGTGVGLAIVQKVVENHKGYISAESAPGKGAMFKILLPVEL